jgi:hypothetical protein
MKIKCISKFQCEVCGAKGSLQIFFNSKGEARYYRVRHKDSSKKFFYHQQSKFYADKELINCGEDLSQTVLSFSHKGLIDLGHIDDKNGQVDLSLISENKWASSSARIEHQPSKLRVKGSNPFPPAIQTLLELNSAFSRSTFNAIES